MAARRARPERRTIPRPLSCIQRGRRRRLCARVRRAASRARPDRRSKSHADLSLRRGARRSATGVGGRAAAERAPYSRGRARHADRPSREEGDAHRPGRVCQCRRSARRRARLEPRAARRQRHGPQLAVKRYWRKTPAALSRAYSDHKERRRPFQPRVAILRRGHARAPAGRKRRHHCDPRARSEKRRGDSGTLRDGGASRGHRSHRPRRSAVHVATRRTMPPCGGASAAGAVRRPPVRRGGRARRLWTGPPRELSPRGGLRREDPQGRDARRSPGRAIDEIRPRPEPEDGESARSDDPPDPPRPRRRGDRMRRRAVVAGLAGTMLAATRASGQARARVGWLTVAPHPGINGFLAGMRALGWVEGDTLAIEYAYAEDRPERLPELAAALARGPVQLVVASGSDAVVAARAHITAKPVVAVSSGAAVGVGENLARPFGNLTAAKRSRLRSRASTGSMRRSPWPVVRRSLASFSSRRRSSRRTRPGLSKPCAGAACRPCTKAAGSSKRAGSWPTGPISTP